MQDAASNALRRTDSSDDDLALRRAGKAHLGVTRQCRCRFPILWGGQVGFWEPLSDQVVRLGFEESRT